MGEIPLSLYAVGEWLVESEGLMAQQSKEEGFWSYLETSAGGGRLSAEEHRLWLEARAIHPPWQEVLGLCLDTDIWT